MKIKNIGEKVIGIEKVVLMPNKEINVAKSVAMSDSVQALVAKGFISIEDEPVKVSEPVEVDKTADEVAEAEPKRTRRTKEKAE